MPLDISVEFDFRSDGGGRDPDTHSPTLRRYHRLLWSKPLPSGAMFGLDDSGPRSRYLHHKSELGELVLSSDAITTRLRAPGGRSVRFFIPFDDFASSPVPRDVPTYLDYRAQAIDFVRARNRRIQDYAASHD